MSVPESRGGHGIVDGYGAAGIDTVSEYNENWMAVYSSENEAVVRSGCGGSMIVSVTYD